MNNTFISLCLLSGRQTADAIAKMIHEVMKDFRLAKKVKFIVTDNGANICKAVKIIQEEKKKAAQKKRLDAATLAKETGRLDDDNLEDDWEDEDLEFVDIELELEDLEENGMISIGNILDSLLVEDTDYNGTVTIFNTAHLPEHIRCASYLLALLALADFVKILSGNCIFNDNYNRSMGKLTKLWNRYNRSTVASDTVHSIFGKRKFIKFRMDSNNTFYFQGCQLKTPGETRWNSKFDAVEDILSKDPAQLDELMTSLKLEILDDEDRQLLNEFLVVMKPLAVYLDILQGEKNNFLGCVLPCILKIKEEIQKIPSNKIQPRGFGSFIRKGILTHIENRFLSYPSY